MASLPFDFASCAVCLENMKDKKPRFLTCHHSFCESCLENLVKQGIITCPTCRAETKVENDDVQNLTLNFHLLQFWEEEINDQVLKRENRGFICHYCKRLRAAKICETCSKLLCQECTAKHAKIEKFKGHVLLSLCWACEEHFEVFTNICTSCSIPVCDTCLLEHVDHDVKQIEPQKYITETANKMQIMKNKLENGVLEIKKFRKEDLEAEEYNQNLKSEVEKIIELCKQKTKEGEEILNEIERYQCSLGNTMNYYDEIENQIGDKLQDVNNFDTHRENYPITEIIDVETSLNDFISDLKHMKIQRYTPLPFSISTKLPIMLLGIEITEGKKSTAAQDHLKLAKRDISDSKDLKDSNQASEDAAYHYHIMENSSLIRQAFDKPYRRKMDKFSGIIGAETLELIKQEPDSVDALINYIAANPQQAQDFYKVFSRINLNTANMIKQGISAHSVKIAAVKCVAAGLAKFIS